MAKMQHLDLNQRAAEFLESLLDRVRTNLPALDRVLAHYGRLSLLDYLGQFSATVEPSLQSCEPLLHIVYRCAEPLLGAAVARRVADDLASQPLVLTANHHGVDYYAQTLQSRLILALRNISGLSPARTLPVFACSNIPLNNLTYPRGLLFYRPPAGKETDGPYRFPLFPDRLKRTMVAATPAWDAALLSQARARLRGLACQGRLAPDTALAAQMVLAEDYRSVIRPALPSYPQQATAVNRLIWQRLFDRGLNPPEMIYLELEYLASELLRQDLADQHSLAHGVFFDKELREGVLAALDGIRGCWNRGALGRRFAAEPREGLAGGAAAPCGTVFFWGRDAAGRRIPLDLHPSGSGKTVLRGRDDSGRITEIPWSPQTLADSLEVRRLYPSLFTSFLVLALARAVSCIGGYYQGEYLPAMQRGLAAALRGTAGYGDVACTILRVPTDLYLDGMAAVMGRAADGGLIPAGPLEIIAGGGLTPDDVARMGSLTVSEAHLAGLYETVSDAVPPELRMTNWRRELANACSALFEGKVVIR